VVDLRREQFGGSSSRESGEGKIEFKRVLELELAFSCAKIEKS
jgi:hypothetical protein